MTSPLALLCRHTSLQCYIVEIVKFPGGTTTVTESSGLSLPHAKHCTHKVHSIRPILWMGKWKEGDDLLRIT